MMPDGDWPGGRVEFFQDRLAVKLREPGGGEDDDELLDAIDSAKGLVRSSTWSVDRVVYEVEGAWVEFCKHCQKLERKLPRAGECELSPLAYAESMMLGRPGAAGSCPPMDRATFYDLVVVLAAERTLSMRVLPFIVGHAYDLEGPEAGVDELFRHGLCAVGDAAWACRGERYMNVQIALIGPVTRSMFSRSGVPYHIGLEPPRAPSTAPRIAAHRAQRATSRAPLRRVEMLSLEHSTAEVCTSVGSRAELRSALLRYADPIAEGESSPLGRLVAALPAIFQSIMRLRPEQLLDEERFATMIRLAQCAWAGLHPGGFRRHLGEDPVLVAQRWLYTPPVLMDDIVEDQLEFGRDWGGLPPLTSAQRSAEQQLLMAMIPFVVYRSILNTRLRQGRSLPVLLGLDTVLGATVIPRGGRIQRLHHAVLMRVERTTSHFAGRADEIWWVDEVPEGVESWLDHLARRVRRARREAPPGLEGG